MRHSLTHGKEGTKMKIELNEYERKMIVVALREAKQGLWNAALDGGKDERKEIMETIIEVINLIEKIK